MIDDEEDVPTSDEDNDEEDDPVQRVVAAVHADKLSKQLLEDANVVVPPATEDSVSTAALLHHLSDLIADAYPDPSTTAQLQRLLSVAVDNLENPATTTTASTEPGEIPTGDQDLDQDDEIPTPNDAEPIANAPDNFASRLEWVRSGDDTITGSKGKPLKLHFFFKSGNVEMRITKGTDTRGDLTAMESIYALWTNEDKVHLILSCPTVARKLSGGRWREARELSMFPSNRPVIEMKVHSECVEATRQAVNSCRFHYLCVCTCACQSMVSHNWHC